MILDCTQWKRLQEQISEALPWFRGKNLLKDHLGSLEKLSGSTLHEVMQIRDRRSYEVFMTGVENPLPLDMVINFANPARPIPFPGVTSDRVRPVLDKLEKDGYVSWEFSRWTERIAFSLHRNESPDMPGGIIFTRCADHDDRMGIMVSDRLYIPISVEF